MLAKLERENINIAVIAVILPFFVMAIVARTPEPAQALSGADAATTFKLTSDPNFKNYKQVLMRFAHKHRPHRENTFCVVGISSAEGKSAWVFWQQGGEIILWEGADTLDSSRRVIHLKSDVVPSEADLHGSTYLVTKSWVAQLSETCSRSGVQVRIGPNYASGKH